MTKGDTLITKQEAAEILRCTVRTIDRLIVKGVFNTYRIPGTRKRLLKRSEINKAIEGSANL